MKKGRLMFWD